MDEIEETTEQVSDQIEEVSEAQEEVETEWEKLEHLMTKQHQELMETLANNQTAPEPETIVLEAEQPTFQEAEILSSSTQTEAKPKNDVEGHPKTLTRKAKRQERKQGRNKA